MAVLVACLLGVAAARGSANSLQVAPTGPATIIKYVGDTTTTTTTTTTTPTTTPTTTTTTPTTTTTTTVVASTFGGQFTAYFGEQQGRRNWRATAVLTLTDELGSPVPGAAVRVLLSPQGSDSEQFSGTTDSSGEVTIVSDRYRLSGGSAVDWIDFRLTSAESADLTWDQQQPTVRVDAP